MSIIGSYRLLSAIENGTYTAATLNTALVGSQKLQEEYLGICTNENMLTRLITSKPEIVFNGSYVNLYGPVISSANDLLIDVLMKNRTAVTYIATTNIKDYFLSFEGFRKKLMYSKYGQEVFGSSQIYGYYNSYRPYLGKMTIETTPTSFSSIASSYGFTNTTIAVINGTLFRRLRGDDNFRRVNISSAITVSSVAYVNNIFVAVGSPSSDALYYSTDDGVSWTKATNPVAQTYNKIVVTNGALFVAVGTSGTIVTSSDGITWTQRTSNVSTNTINDAINDGTYIWCACNGGYIARSSDGVTWTGYTNTNTTTTVNFLSIASNGTTVVAVGSALTSKNYAYSTNSGTSWTSSAIISTTTNIGSVVYTTSGFYAGATTASTNLAAYSQDGITWTNINFGTSATSRVSTYGSSGGVICITPNVTTLGISINDASVKANAQPTRNADNTIITGGTSVRVIIDAMGIFALDNNGVILSSLTPKV